MKPLTNKQQKLYQNTKIYVFKEKFEDRHAKNNKMLQSQGPLLLYKGILRCCKWHM